ncbi:MAG: cytochrome-c peroxidase [Flavobacteriales bacterium]|nr:cytochrome-c peroxidase [Flavobacteriales bacterium]
MKWLLTILILFTACKKAVEKKTFIESESDYQYHLIIPNGFPLPLIPVDNELTESRVLLGKTLFYDPILSSDSSVSCATCHRLNLAFTDGLELSKGVENRTGMRNTPTLTNIAYAYLLMFDGGAETLELQALAPIADHNEMNSDMKLVIERLKKNKKYISLFKKAYQRDLDAFGITRSIAAFQRTLISGNSPFDKYYFRGDTTALSASEQRGMKLFFSESLSCSECHGGFNFTNNHFENNGLYTVYADTGRARITNLSSDVGKFKVPTLRNVEYTSPYMHDGSFSSLEEVIAHYALGGKNHVNKSVLVKGFNISEAEKQDLINFLKSLSDKEFLNNKNFIP